MTRFAQPKNIFAVVSNDVEVVIFPTVSKFKHKLQKLARVVVRDKSNAGILRSAEHSLNIWFEIVTRDVSYDGTDVIAEQLPNMKAHVSVATDVELGKVISGPTRRFLQELNMELKLPHAGKLNCGRDCSELQLANMVAAVVHDG